jgi:TonB-linked SusC/RagA family outer membrane protein
MFRDTDNIYIISDRQVVIGKAPRKALEAQLTSLRKDIKLNSNQQQLIEITGKVTDVSGAPLPGATVMVKGTNIGTITNVDGIYLLGNVPKNATLVFSFIGMKTQEVQISNMSIVNVVMEEEAIGLEEVVAIGYGTQKKGSIIGSIDRVLPQQLKLPTRTISTSLAGRLAGIVSVQRNGEPGYDAADFWIRGVNTFTGNTSPLVLVDGVERAIDNIDPEEIADFTILKDATATAIYGVRGANGVVLITTKKGSIGKPKINFRTEVNVSDPLELPDFVDGPTYMKLQNEALRNNGKNPLFSDEQISRTASGYDPYYYPNVNWIKELISHWSPSEKVTLNVSGGSELVRYFVSGAFLNQGGMWKNFGGTSYNNNVNVKRYNFRSKTGIIPASPLLRFLVGCCKLHRFGFR